MKLIVSCLLCLLLLADAVSPVYAKLSINEFSSGTGSDWVEIYNDSDTEVPLSLYRLRDNTSTNKLDLNGILSGKGFIIFEWSDRLNNTGDIIKIVKIDDESVEEDKVIYGNLEGRIVDAPSASQFAARVSDGGGAWALFTSSTKGATNVNATPAPTSTPMPTETPKPTPSATKTPTPGKQATPTETRTADPAPNVTRVSQVAGSTVKRVTPTPDYHVPTSVLAKKSVSAWPTIAPSVTPGPVRTLGVSRLSPSVWLIGVGTLFLLSCLGYGYRLYRKGQL